MATMNLHADAPDAASGRDFALQPIRTTLAYLVLLLGLAASVSAIPAAVWALVRHGLH